ncbi:MAG: bidirectional hydrogenase complex protein HoxU [Candidatus Brocadiaceae bacterium]|nr:bidirectional hydrogenase complex protein HoxU [Candidatus Brocadiaceae bacterium]
MKTPPVNPVTPESAPRPVKTLKIDGLDVSGREDQTILEVAREHNICIPAICHLDGLSGVGACRLCLVEIVGSPRLVPACVTRVAEGMEVITKSPRLNKYRRMILEMFFAERNHVCAVCVANGHCELQTLARDLGMNHVSVAYLHPRVGVDATHERFTIDHNRCILCMRCVRVCAEIEGARTWGVKGRGIESRVITDFDGPWGESKTCTGCGKCVQVCPTGALFEKGTAAAEVGRREFLPYLTTMREETP